MTAKFPAY